MMTISSIIQVKAHPTEGHHPMKSLNHAPEMTGTHLPRQAHCPSCDQYTAFTFLGEQRWPEKVAEKLGIPAVVEQWLCGTCHTTITNPNLQ
jgi:hypothetical protein